MSQVFYGRTIVAVGFLAHIASAFSISSTLRVFLKPLGVSRGVFSLIRSGEVLISAVAAIVRLDRFFLHLPLWLFALLPLF
jgi:hypothetical protein